jgi:hypothetical protein
MVLIGLRLPCSTQPPRSLLHCAMLHLVLDDAPLCSLCPPPCITLRHADLVLDFTLPDYPALPTPVLAQNICAHKPVLRCIMRFAFRPFIQTELVSVASPSSPCVNCRPPKLPLKGDTKISRKEFNDLKELGLVSTAALSVGILVL